MKSALRRSISQTLAARPSSSSPRSSSLRAPAPIMLRAASSGTGGSPSRSRMKLSALIRSGAVSTSVPSRSNAMVGASVEAGVMEMRYRGRRDYARWAGPRLPGGGGGITAPAPSPKVHVIGPIRRYSPPPNEARQAPPVARPAGGFGVARGDDGRIEAAGGSARAGRGARRHEARARHGLDRETF